MDNQQLSPYQLSCIEKLVNVTSVTRKQAQAILDRFGWEVEIAADAFFGGDVSDVMSLSDESTESGMDVDMDKVDAWFDRLADPDDEDEGLDREISEEGIEMFCKEIGIDLQSPVILVISWKMEADDMSHFNRGEFRKGMVNLGVDTSDMLKDVLPGLQEFAADVHSDEYKAFYAYCFDFAKEGTKKNLSKDEAVALWEVLLEGRFKLGKRFLEWMPTSSEVVVTRDLWIQTLEFLKCCEGGLESYRSDDSWPVAIDDFVEWARAKGEGADTS
ncbi:unnamed protein product [Chrysoparadoxa australica]